MGHRLGKLIDRGSINRFFGGADANQTVFFLYAVGGLHTGRAYFLDHLENIASGLLIVRLNMTHVDVHLHFSFQMGKKNRSDWLFTETD